MTPLRWRRYFARFGVKIYVLGLLQFFAVGAAVVAILVVTRPRVPFGEDLRFVIEGLEQVGDDRPRLKHEVARVESTLGWSIAVYDQGEKIAGTLVVDSVPESLPMPMPGDVGPLGGPPPPGARARRFPLHLRAQHPPAWLIIGEVVPPAPTTALITAAVLALVLIGISSWFTARSLSQPLQRLSDAASAFGRGKLTTRAGLERHDELGDVSRAFDQMAERLTTALVAERELLANVSHELRTPLQRIHIAVELAVEGDADTARESLREVVEDLHELERIVDDILTAARLSRKAGLRGYESAPSSSPPVRLVPISLDDVIERAASRFTLAHEDMPLRIRIDTELGLVDADAMLLRRVLDNLLQNAHAYSDDPARGVEIVALRRGDACVIEVHDNGIGLSADDLPRVFEPFFRADRSRSRATGGLGLGLTLSRHIVESHGGTLCLESVPGRGTVARITLPLARASA